MSNLTLFKAGKPCLCDVCHKPIDPARGAIGNESLNMVVCDMQCVDKHCLSLPKPKPRLLFMGAEEVPLTCAGVIISVTPKR